MLPRIAPITRALLIVTVGVYLIQYLMGTTLLYYFALWPPVPATNGWPPFEIWQVLTSGFVHGGWNDLFFNMLGLLLVGSQVEQLLGPKRFLAYYLLCIVGGSLMLLILIGFAHLPPAPAIGAAGGVFGLMAAIAVLFPHRTVMLLFPPVPMRAWLLVTLFVVFELTIGLMHPAEGGASFGHLGGLATGFVVMRYWKSRDPRLAGG